MVNLIERQILQSKIIDRIQQIQQQHPDMQQQYFEIQLNQERRKMVKKVNESKEMYKARIEEEGKKQQKDQQKKHETAEPGIDGEAASEQAQDSHIDIKV
jgi:hypothetical protein